MRSPRIFRGRKMNRLMIQIEKINWSKEPDLKKLHHELEQFRQLVLNVEKTLPPE